MYNSRHRKEMLNSSKNFRELVTTDKLLGRGTYGEVYGPCDWDEKKCALKQRWLTGDVQKVEPKELLACHTWKSLRHRSLITVYDISLEPHAIYIMMEYASGKSLRTVLSVLHELKSELPMEVLLDWSFQIAEGMAYLHEVNIVHRDLKSPNIVLIEADASSNPHNKTLKITDFDQIRDHDGTKTMSAAGTYAWMAPEVITKQNFSKKSDVWSYGVVLWEILTKYVPHKDVSDIALICIAMKGSPLKLKLPYPCPDIFNCILKRCQSTEKAERPSFGEILIELQGHPETKNVASRAAPTVKDLIRKYRRFLKEYMEPDFGLLDKICEKGIIERKEVEDVTDRNRNSKLLDYILAKDRSGDLIETLRDTDQMHIVNYVLHSGEFSKGFYEEWPLMEMEISLLDTNRGYLVDDLILNDLLDHLFSSNVVNKRQFDSISSMSTPHEKNKKLLDILRRRSLRDYHHTIECLRRSHQDHIATVLCEGGVAVKVYIDLDGKNVTEAESRIVTMIENLLNDSSVDQRRRMLVLDHLSVIAAKSGQGVVLYTYCKNFDELKQLRESLISGELKDSIDMWFKRLLDRSPKIAMAAISYEEFHKMRVHFKGVEDDLSKTTLNELPFEMLEVVLENTFLHWILSPSTHRRDQDVIKTLASVDFCWLSRITRRRFKSRICLRLKGFYENNKKRNTIIRNNRDFLLENIRPNDELLAGLLYLKCITKEQSSFIQGKYLDRNDTFDRPSEKENEEKQRSDRDKNWELLNLLRSFDEEKFANFVTCLQKTNQLMVSRIIEKGGVIVKVEVTNRWGQKRKMEIQKLFRQRFADLSNKAIPLSQPTDELMRQLKEEGIEIISSQLNRENVVVWIWCRSQAALQNIQKLYESMQLRDVLSFLASFPPEVMESKVIKIDRNQFKKTVAECSISINFTEKIEKEDKDVYGVSKLRNKIYVLCHTNFCKNVISVFEDREPFCLQKEIEITEMKFAVDIGSSEKENCLYVADQDVKCLWKITKEAGDEHKIIRWLATDHEPDTLSVSSDGQLLVVNRYRSIISIYGSDKSLLLRMQLPKDIIKNPRHAVKTSNGNVIIIHQRVEVKEGKTESSGEEMEQNWVLSELNIEGCFVYSNEIQQLVDPEHLSIDCEDQVFVVDKGNHGVFLLDSNFKWNRLLGPKNEAKEISVQWPRRLFYDGEKRQLIVGGDGGASAYALSFK